MFSSETKFFMGHNIFLIFWKKENLQRKSSFKRFFPNFKKSKNTNFYVRLSVCPSVRPSVRPPVRHTKNRTKKNKKKKTIRLIYNVDQANFFFFHFNVGQKLGKKVPFFGSQFFNQKKWKKTKKKNQQTKNQ